MTQPTSSTLPPIGTDWGPINAPPGWGQTTPPAAPPAKRKIGRYIVGGVVVLFIVAALAGGEDKKDTTTSNGVVTATTSVSPSTPSAASTASSSSVGAWAVRYGSDDASTLGGDLDALTADANAEDVVGMSTSCRAFQRHLATATSHLPTPDAQLTSALSRAYGYFDLTATACIKGIATMDPDELAKMMTYLPLGTASLREASTRLNSFM